MYLAAHQEILEKNHTSQFAQQPYLRTNYLETNL